MDLTLTVAGQSPADAQSLQEWMYQDDDLRGRAQLAPATPSEGKLGTLTDALIVAIGPGGAALSLASIVISWIRNRHSDVEVKITRPDGASISVTAKRVNAADSTRLRPMVSELADWAAGEGDGPRELNGPRPEGS
jgi:hypothetical protein